MSCRITSLSLFVDREQTVEREMSKDNEQGDTRTNKGWLKPKHKQNKKTKTKKKRIDCRSYLEEKITGFGIIRQFSLLLLEKKTGLESLLSQ